MSTQAANTKAGGDPATDEYHTVKATWITQTVRKLFGLPAIPDVKWRKTACTVCGTELRTCAKDRMQGPQTHVLCAVTAARSAQNSRMSPQAPEVVDNPRRHCSRLEADLNQENKRADAMHDAYAPHVSMSGRDRAEALELANWLLKQDAAAPGRQEKLDRFNAIMTPTGVDVLLGSLITGLRQQGLCFFDAFVAGWNTHRAKPDEPCVEGPEYTTCRQGWKMRQRLTSGKA